MTIEEETAVSNAVHGAKRVYDVHLETTWSLYVGTKAADQATKAVDATIIIKVVHVTQVQYSPASLIAIALYHNVLRIVCLYQQHVHAQRNTSMWTG
jgi:hypothetical protein